MNFFNKKTIEIKKKILLSEARKKAYIGEWTEKERQNIETITELKRNIKELNTKLIFANSSKVRKCSAEPHESIQRVSYSSGAKTEAETNLVYDLKITDLQKRKDLVFYQSYKSKTKLDQLLEQYNELLSNKTENLETITSETPPATVEEHLIKRRVCHLENEIHKINVQWMEAEHVKKKYKSIKSSLTTDSDKFEKSLFELEQAIEDQQVDINKIKVINHDALQMKDSTRVLLHKQEYTANSFAKMRDKQNLELKKHVEDRKSELERLERKLFSAGKVIIHQGSTESLSGEHQNENADTETDPNALALNKTSELENLFKELMIITGATSADEVLERFISQKESSSRLNYLRTITEDEKKNLEIQREMLLSQLDFLKFSDIKENENNQEQVEGFKREIQKSLEVTRNCFHAKEQIRQVINYIRLSLIDLITRLLEIDEALIEFSDIAAKKISSELCNISESTKNEELLIVLQEKIKIALIEVGNITFHKNNRGLDENFETVNKIMQSIKPVTPSSRPSSTTDEKEKPQPFPSCYATFISGRNTGQLSAGSPGQINQAVGTDDEGDVPSRFYLKRQALLIVDSKSRRKGFRVPRR